MVQIRFKRIMAAATEAGFICARPDLIDGDEILAFIRKLHKWARQTTVHLPDPGKLQMTVVHPTTGHAIYPRFQIGDVQAMVDGAIRCAKLGYNVWLQGRTVRSDLEPHRSPRLEDTVWVLALVIDYDGYGGAPFRESFAVQTSPGHVHYWYLTSLSPKQALEISPRFKAAAAADSDSGVISQDYRIPGTPNYPTARKLSDGRQVEPTFSLPDRHGGPAYAFESLDQRLPAPAMTYTPPVASDLPPGRTLDQIREHLWTKAGMADKLLTLRMLPGDRSTNFSKACFIAFSSGLTLAEIEVFIWSDGRHGCASKWIGRGELREQLARQWRDWSTLGKRF